MYPIANPASGPGVSANAAWTDVINRSAAAGQTPIGYVSTSFGARSGAAVHADIDAWYALYPNIKGIFFDEVPTSGTPSNLTKYLNYRDYAKTKGASVYVTFNPGTLCDETFLSTCAPDLIVMSEAGNGRFALPAWTSGYTIDHFAFLSYATTRARMLDPMVGGMVAAGYGVGYCTDDALVPNPWNDFCTYWASQVTALKHAR